MAAVFVDGRGLSRAVWDREDLGHHAGVDIDAELLDSAHESLPVCTGQNPAGLVCSGAITGMTDASAGPAMSALHLAVLVEENVAGCYRIVTSMGPFYGFERHGG